MTQRSEEPVGARARPPIRGIEVAGRAAVLRDRLPGGVRHGLRDGARAYGALTSQVRAPADFLIIGAKKAGTSSLMNWLLRHPAVAGLFPGPQGIKSPHYFDINYWRGPRWYLSHFPTRASRRRQERACGSLSVAGEASPYYLFHPAAAERATADLPAARVIALLREPVARAYSNFWDRKTFGSEEFDRFEDALEAEPDRLASVDQDRLRHDPHYYSFHHDHHSYRARGRYAEQLRPWLDRVSADRMLVLAAEDMFRDPAGTFVTVQRFLRIPVSGAIPLRRYNERSTPPIDADTRAAMAEYYRPHNAALYELLGRDLGWDC